MDGAPTITAWQPIATAASTTQSIDNQITLRWLVPHPSFASVDKIMLTLTDLFGNTQDVEVAPALDPTSTATYALYTFALQINNKPISYPLAVTRLRLYAGAELLRDTPQPAIIASQIARRGAHTLGLHLSIAITPAVSWLNVSGYGASREITVTTIGTSTWTASATGDGLSVTPATGTSGQTATITWDPHFGTTAPPTRSGSITFATTPNGATVTLATAQNGVVPINAIRIGNLWWSTMNVGATLPSAVGGYYTWNQALTVCPAGWRLPTNVEFGTISQYSAQTSYNGMGGRWFGPLSGWSASNAIFFPAGDIPGGSGVGMYGYYWSSIEYNSANAYFLSFASNAVVPQGNYVKTYRFAVRCVQ